MVAKSLTSIGALCLAVAGCAGCGPGEQHTGDTATDPTSDWEAIAEGWSGTALSLWGTSSTDLWAASSDPSGSDYAHHWDGQDWSTVDVGATENLWWVTSYEGSEMWFVGEQGTVIRYDVATETATPLPSGTAAGTKLFGAWVSPEGTLWAVGGVPDAGPAAVLRVEGDVVSTVDDLPGGLNPTETWFKVWGTSDTDLWVIGDRGSVLHYDGAWTRQVMPESPRLVTIHGSGTDVVIVGGQNGPVIFENDGANWSDVSPRSGSAMNGIFVSSNGDALAAGWDAFAWLREDGLWSELERPTTTASWHAAWMDENGDLYVGGGNLMGLSDGVVMRYER